MNYNIFCAHHAPLTARKKYLEDKRKEYNFDLTYIESHQAGIDLPKNIYKISDAELSLYLKHLDIYKIIEEKNIEDAFIIEDDLIVEIDLNSFFKRIILEKSDYDLIFFGGTADMLVKNPNTNNLVYGNYTSSRCTHGYFITNRAAKLLIDSNHFNKPIDHALNEFIASLNLKVAWTYPHLSQKTVEKLEQSSIR